MALQKQSVAIPFGSGVQQGTDDKLVEAPALLGLIDARTNKRGAHAKRYGSTAILTTGLTSGAAPGGICTRGDQLAQYTSEGLHVYDSSAGKWRRNNVAGPRPCRIETDPLVRGNDSATDADLAYDPTSGIACVVYRDEGAERIVASFVDADLNARIATSTLPSSLLVDPRVVFFDGRFLAFGRDGSNNIFASYYSPTAGNYTWSSAVLVRTGTGNDAAFDVHVADSGQSYCHLAVARMSLGWVAYKIDNAGAIAATQVSATGGRDARCIAVYHNPDVSLVYVLFDDTDSTPVLSLDRFADDYLGIATRTTVLNYTAVPSVGSPQTRRVTLAKKSESHDLWCFASHAQCDGGDEGGIEFRAVNSSGAPQGTAAFVPGLILATQAAYDGRTVVGVSRETWFALALNGTRFATDPKEPLPSAFLVTPVSTSSGDTLAVLGRFGHDRIAASSAFGQTATFVGSLEAVGDEFWAGYRVLVESNPGAPDPGFLTPDYGWRGGVDLLRANTAPTSVERAEAEGLALQAGGVLACFDGVRSAEAAVPVVPLEPGYFHAIAALASGASGTPYSGVATWNGTESGTQYTVARMKFKYLFRWIDAAGQVHRSCMSEERQRTVYVNDNMAGYASVSGPDGVGEAFDLVGDSPYTDYTRVLLIPKPSPTALDEGSLLQVELYRTDPVFSLYDTSAVPNTLVQTETRGAQGTGDAVFRLVGVLDIGDVTGYPNLGWIEDPTADNTIHPARGAAQPYDDGGELGAEPPPALLDICSTQQRLFAIDAEDRLSIPFTKPFTKGYAPEWNASLAIRCAAEGGDLVACEVLDDKLVLFKERRIYVVPVLSGPDALGNGSAFLAPREITADSGCVERRSIAKGPFGIVFQSERGICLLDRGMNITFIGEAVKDSLSGRTIVAATVVPAESEVRFCLETKVLGDGTNPTSAIVWNYRVDQWAIWEHLDSIDATQWAGGWTRLLSTGVVHIESVGAYDMPDGFKQGGGPRPMLQVTTGWIKLAGLQGFQRVWTATLLGDYFSGDLTVDVGYNYASTWTDSHDFTEAQILALPAGLQLRIRPSIQKCQAIRFRIRERDLGGADPSIGAGFVLQGLQLDVGIKQGSYKLLGNAAKR